MCKERGDNPSRQDFVSFSDLIPLFIKNADVSAVKYNRSEQHLTLDHLKLKSRSIRGLGTGVLQICMPSSLRERC